MFCTVKPHYSAIVRVQKRHRETNNFLRWNVNEINIHKPGRTFFSCFVYCQNRGHCGLKTLKTTDILKIYTCAEIGFDFHHAIKAREYFMWEQQCSQKRIVSWRLKAGQGLVKLRVAIIIGDEGIVQLLLETKELCSSTRPPTLESNLAFGHCSSSVQFRYARFLYSLPIVTEWFAAPISACLRRGPPG